MPGKSSEADIKTAIKTRNANGPIEIKDSMGRVVEKRYLCLDFAYAFVQILRRRYRKKKAESKTGKLTQQEFEEMMEGLLDELFCSHKPLRSGYKAIAGHTIGFGEPDGEPRTEEEKAADPLRILAGEGNQLTMHNL